jgi:uncharacterized protein YigA (DUF484 family)
MDRNLASKHAESPGLSQIEQQTVDFLRSDPDFFDRHPDLLQTMRISHGVGSARSLLEYQVALLRKRNEYLQKHLAEIIGNARDNEGLNRRLHMLLVNLVRAPSFDDAIETVERGLRTDFRAEEAVVRLYGRVESVERWQYCREPEPLSAIHGSVRRLLGDGEPWCGRLRGEHWHHIFGRIGAGSGVVVPFACSHLRGLVCMASSDVERFHPSMGTIFLEQLAEILSAVLARYVG